MKRSNFCTCLSGAVVLLFVAPLRGEIILDHQPHNYGGPSSDTSFLTVFGQPYWQRLADDFILGNPDQIVRLIYWGFYDADNPPATETMRVRIYGARQSNGSPDEGSIISETTVPNPIRAATGRIVNTGIGPHEYRYEAQLSTPVSVEAGVLYWLEVVQIGDINTKFRWEDSVTEFNGHSFINPQVMDWQVVTNQGDLAFQLLTPEPASFAMLALGVVLLARRR